MQLEEAGGTGQGRGREMTCWQGTKTPKFDPRPQGGRAEQLKLAPMI